MEKPNPETWIRYSDYKEVMAEKARLEGKHVEDVLAFHDDVRAWTVREYPEHSKLNIAHLADHVTWDRFFDPRDNPIKAPHRYNRKNISKARGEKEKRVTEPYASIERQLVIAFAVSFPKTSLLTFFSHLDSLESEFAARMDLSDAEKKWGVEKAAWTHFWTTPGEQEEFEFPGIQPKVITDAMIRQTGSRGGEANMGAKLQGQDQGRHFPQDIETLIGNGDLHKSPEQDSHDHEKQGHNEVTFSNQLNDKASSSGRPKKRERQEYAPSPPGGRGGQSAENMTYLAAGFGNSNGPSHSSLTIDHINSVHELQDPYRKTRPRGAAHVSQMPLLLADEAERVVKPEGLTVGSIQRFYGFRLYTYLRDGMHRNKTLGELQAFAQSDTLKLVDSYEKPEGCNDRVQRVATRKRRAESLSDTSEGDTEPDELFDSPAGLVNSRTFGTPRTRLMHKGIGASSDSPGFTQEPPGEGERVRNNMGRGSSTSYQSNSRGSMQDTNMENDRLGNMARQDNALAFSFSTNPSDFTFKGSTMVERDGGKTRPKRYDPYHDTRPVGSPYPDPLPRFEARKNDFIAKFANFKPNSINEFYSGMLAKLLRAPGWKNRKLGDLEAHAEMRTFNKCDADFRRFSISNPPVDGVKGDRIFFKLSMTEPEDVKPPKKKSKQGP